jgi:hypothetical protein
MIISSELVIRKSASRTDTATNGGRMSKNAVVSGARQNFLPDWTLAQVTAGGSRLRKYFLHVANDDDLALTQAGLHLTSVSSGDDRVTLFAGTTTDTQATLAASPTEYGAGVLQSALTAGATVLSVTVEDMDMVVFRSGDQICITDGTNYEYHENVTVSNPGGGLVTITLAAGDMLSSDFAAGATVASVLPLGTIQAAIGTPAVTSASGTLDATKITPDAIGGVDHTVTITFTSATAFSAVSDVHGSLGTGAINADFAPANADFSKPYFKIASGTWGGIWVAGNVVTFASVAAAVAFWVKGVLPAGAAPAGDDTFGLRVIGGSN